MSAIMIEATAIPDVKIITGKKFGDRRGFFSEVYNRKAFAEAGIALDFVQDIIRFPPSPAPCAACISSRRPSPSTSWCASRAAAFSIGRGHQAKLADFRAPCRWNCRETRQHLVPIGFAHGFATLEPDTEVIYKVSDYYSAANDLGLAWDDPDLGIAWPLPPGGAVLSDKDRTHPRLRDLPAIFD